MTAVFTDETLPDRDPSDDSVAPDLWGDTSAPGMSPCDFAAEYGFEISTLQLESDYQGR